MPSAKQHAAEIVRLKQQATVYRLRLQHLTEVEIGERLGISHQAVSRCILREQERLRYIRDLTNQQRVEQETAELDLVKREAWRGWTRSLRDAVETTEQDGGQNSGAVSTKRKGQSGNPAHLAAVIRASERIAKLYGLDAPPPSKDPETEAIGGDLEILEVVIDETDEADRLRDHHVVAVRSERIQPAALKETPPDVAPTSKTPKPKSRSRRQAKATPKADKKAAGVRPAPEPHKRVRGRPRGRKD
jgi:hypothetical protein